MSNGLPPPPKGFLRPWEKRKTAYNPQGYYKKSTSSSSSSGGRGTGRVRSEDIDKEAKKRPGYTWNSRTYSWDKDPNFKGGSGFNPTATPGVLDKKKKEEVPTEMQFTSASPEKLKIKKKKGKKDFRYKGSMGTNQQRGLSGLSIGGV